MVFVVRSAVGNELADFLQCLRGWWRAHLAWVLHALGRGVKVKRTKTLTRCTVVAAFVLLVSRHLVCCSASETGLHLYAGFFSATTQVSVRRAFPQHSERMDPRLMPPSISSLRVVLSSAKTGPRSCELNCVAETAHLCKRDNAGATSSTWSRKLNTFFTDDRLAVAPSYVEGLIELAAPHEANPTFRKELTELIAHCKAELLACQLLASRRLGRRMVEVCCGIQALQGWCFLDTHPGSATKSLQVLQEVAGSRGHHIGSIYELWSRFFLDFAPNIHELMLIASHPSLKSVQKSRDSIMDLTPHDPRAAAIPSTSKHDRIRQDLSRSFQPQRM